MKIIKYENNQITAMITKQSETYECLFTLDDCDNILSATIKNDIQIMKEDLDYKDLQRWQSIVKDYIRDFRYADRK